MKKRGIILVLIFVIATISFGFVSGVFTEGGFDRTSISENGFYGGYVGLEFSYKGDVAHQFSNKVAKVVGKYLKDSYSRGVYLKVDFKNTKIKTIGMDQNGFVNFTIDMPFIKVNKSNAYTGIVHCGTWVNQKDSRLNVRLKEQLRKLKRISFWKPNYDYFKTDGGYKEYWIQFKHYKYQN